jgi:hypothetical protein
VTGDESWYFMYDPGKKTSECNLDEFKETESSESENAKIVSENNIDCFFYAKGIIHHKFVVEKQTANGKFYKEVIERLITRIHRVRPEFQERVSCVFCTTMH